MCFIAPDGEDNACVDKAHAALQGCGLFQFAVNIRAEGPAIPGKDCVIPAVCTPLGGERLDDVGRHHTAIICDNMGVKTDLAILIVVERDVGTPSLLQNFFRVRIRVK